MASPQKKILIAMSGGVDSSMAAALLKQQGHEVIAVHFLLWRSEQGGGCESAQKSAEQLGMDFRALDLREKFRDMVVEYFVNEYLRGRTPNPCSLCNPQIKFAALATLADELGAQFISTGHYAQIEFDACRCEPRMLEAVDKSKDQSYFLAMLDKKILSRVVLPLGSLKKSEVKDRARGLGLDCAGREESQDVCFALDRGYTHVIEALRPGAARPGDVVDGSGKKIGTHKGIHCYTVGQHRGLALNRPDLFVTAVDAAANRVVVGGEQELYHSSMKVSGLNWLTGTELPVECQAKIRYRSEKAECRVMPAGGDAVVATFEKPQRAITPGQSAVFYLGERVLGGGWIESAFD
jgi:tRNA-uridine 2-sulfurtransferase